MLLTQLETPALACDRKKFLENIEIMKTMLEGKTLKLRPHFKSNKCAAIARLQIEKGGAKGITCAKLSEAMDLADAGIEDILIANQIVEPAKIAKAAELAKCCHLTVCIDSAENAQGFSKAAVNAGSTVYCYVELDIGMKRCGARSEDEFVEIAKVVNSLPNLEFSGIQAYAGNIAHMKSRADRETLMDEFHDRLRALIAHLAKEGIAVKEISGGSTGSSVLKAQKGLYTELQAGSYIFLDSTYGKVEELPFRHSLFVLATVISVHAGGRFETILDAGVKALGSDQDLPEVYTMDGKHLSGDIEVNEEHMKFYSDYDPQLKLGEKVLIIPGHCCSTVNLYDKLYFFEDGKITGRTPVSARGCSR